MINLCKVQTTSDFCKSHSARSEREPCKISPSKLSKKELEDQHYALVEDNISLKKMVNSQSQQVRLLSAKMLRLTESLKRQGRDGICCSGIRAVVEEQKECIADLKQCKERMSEKIKSLNMRLCSAKQFAKRTPAHSARCLRCSRTSLAKNTSSVSAVHTKRSDANIQTSMVSSQYYDNVELISPKSVKTEVSKQYENDIEHCHNNKCENEMEALKLEITHLKEELNTLHKSDVLDKISALEDELTRTKAENTRARAERNSCEQSVREKEDLCRSLGTRLREVEARCSDLTLQLSIEKKRVLEMEAQLRSAQLSNRLSRTLEEHFDQEKQKRITVPNKAKRDVQCCTCTQNRIPADIKPAMDEKQQNISSELLKESKCSDDSGFGTERNDGITFDKINEDLINRIAKLQSQLNEIKISTVTNNVTTESNVISRNISDDDNERNQRNVFEISQASVKNSSKSASTDIYVQPKSSDKVHNPEKNVKKGIKLKNIVKERVIRKKNTNKTESISKKSSTNIKYSPKVMEEYFNDQLVNEKEDTRKDVQRSRTYSIKRNEPTRAASPADTEYEISSISESSHNEKSSRLSLGERRMSTFSESYTVTSSEGSEVLSEGELPYGREILSVGERPVLVKSVSPFTNPREPIAKKMESTLEAISLEMSRCSRLLQASQVRGLP